MRKVLLALAGAMLLTAIIIMATYAIVNEGSGVEESGLVRGPAEPVPSLEINVPEASPETVLPDVHSRTDDRYHQENWSKLQVGITDAKLNIRSLHDIAASAPVPPEEFEISVETGTGTVKVQLQKVRFDGRTIAIPKYPDQLSVQFEITPDGRKSIVTSDRGIWRVDLRNNRLHQLSSDTYNGTTYAALVKKSMDVYGKNVVSWNGAVLPSPDSTKLIYFANKNNIEGGGYSLFSYDFASGAEKLIAELWGAFCDVNGWLDSTRLICTKYQDSGNTAVLIDLDGKETELRLDDETSYVYSVQDGRVAYVTPDSSGGGEFTIASVGETGTLQTVVSVRIEGTLRIQGGNGFSPDSAYAAFIYVPDDEPYARYLKVVNLRNGAVTDIEAFPDGTDSSAVVLSFTWVNENTLHVVIQEEASGKPVKSNWTYSLT